MPVGYILGEGTAGGGLFVYFTLVDVPSCVCAKLHPPSRWDVLQQPQKPQGSERRKHVSNCSWKGRCEEGEKGTGYLKPATCVHLPWEGESGSLKACCNYLLCRLLSEQYFLGSGL